MKKIILSLILSLLCASTAFAVEVAGVNLESAVTVNSQSLKLNGYGIRKKLFVKVYIGSLYTVKKFVSPAELLADSGDKLIRMNFLHSKVDKEKIIEAYQEGFANNSSGLAGSPDVKKFLSFFSGDFMKGDVVDLALLANGTVTATHNGRQLGQLQSPKLAKGVLAIYFGDKPADESLKKGMLGKE